MPPVFMAAFSLHKCLFLRLWGPYLGYSRFCVGIPSSWVHGQAPTSFFVEVDNNRVSPPPSAATHMLSTSRGLYEMSCIVPVVVNSVSCRKPLPLIFVPPTCQITVLVWDSAFFSEFYFFLVLIAVGVSFWLCGILQASL